MDKIEAGADLVKTITNYLIIIIIVLKTFFNLIV